MRTFAGGGKLDERRALAQEPPRRPRKLCSARCLEPVRRGQELWSLRMLDRWLEAHYVRIPPAPVAQEAAAAVELDVSE